MHAIMADKAVSGVREGSTVYYAEVFRWLNTWFQHKGLAEALHIIFVFDGDLRLEFQHCPDCQRQAQTRMDAKNKVAGAARAASKQQAADEHAKLLLATQQCVEGGFQFSERQFKAKRDKLRKLATAAKGRDDVLLHAILLWIHQHQNHLQRDAEHPTSDGTSKEGGGGGSGGGGGGGAKASENTATQSAAAKRRGSRYDVHRARIKRCPITIVMAGAEADDYISFLCKNGYADVAFTIDSDMVLRGCPVVIIDGLNDRRQQSQHFVSVVNQDRATAHLKEVLLGVDNASAAWRDPELFAAFQKERAKKVKGKSKSNAGDDGGGGGDGQQAHGPTARSPPAAGGGGAAAGGGARGGAAGAAARRRAAAGIGARGAGASAAAPAAATKSLALPFRLKRKALAEALALPTSMRLAQRVLATIMGTDFCAGILPAVDAVVYTALYMQSTPGEARNEAVREAYRASRGRSRPLNGALWEGTSADDYLTAFDAARRHFETEFTVTMSPQDWEAFLYGTARGRPASNAVIVRFPCNKTENDPSEIARVLRYAATTSTMTTSEAVQARFAVPCKELDFACRTVELWSTEALEYWLRARSCDPPSWWLREHVVGRVYYYLHRRDGAMRAAAASAATAAAAGSDAREVLARLVTDIEVDECMDKDLYWCQCVSLCRFFCAR
jgi:uncharacterized membrane protein YgcG